MCVRAAAVSSCCTVYVCESERDSACVSVRERERVCELLSHRRVVLCVCVSVCERVCVCECVRESVCV